MKISEWDALFHEYAARVIQQLQSDDLTSTFQDYFAFLVDRIQKMPAWQVALPVISCLATGGSSDDGIIVASAWVPLYLASEILDNVEDKEFTPDRFVASPEVATNMANSLIFAAFHALTHIQDANRMSQITRIFASSGYDAAYGQHRDLTKIPSPVEQTLNNYWEMIILKSGSVFRAATAAGAAAGSSDETIVEALGDYGTALGAMLQLIDDCRDAFTSSQEAIKWESSLPLLLYLMAIGEENIVFPQVSLRAEWSELLKEKRVIQAISSLLLQWKSRLLESLEPLPESREKHILESIPSLFLE